MLVNIGTLFISITTLAMGGWQAAFRRVSEAISSLIPIMGVITLIVLLAIVLGGRHDIYHWLDSEAVAHDHILKHKSGFLNPYVFLGASIVVIGLWTFLSRKLHHLSLQSDDAGAMDPETSRKSWVFRLFRCIIFTECWFNHAMALDDEYRSSLVQYDV